MAELRVGLVGRGSSARPSTPFISGDDRDSLRIRRSGRCFASVRAVVGARYGVPALYATLGEMLVARLDAVVIAAPDLVHPELAVAALDAGLHVLCEAPLALTVADMQCHRGSPRPQRPVSSRSPI